MSDANELRTDYAFEYVSGDRAGTTSTVTVVLDESSLDRKNLPRENLPDWTALEYQQCSSCPLSTAENTRCPAAVALAELADVFRGVSSFEEAVVSVRTNGRTIGMETTVQKGLRSLMGLSMATCGCPGLARFKPLARFHLPFATREDTLNRMVGSYFIAQYLLAAKGAKHSFDLADLKAWYEQVHEINRSLAARMGDAWEGDAGSNALVLLDVLAQELPMSIDADLREMEPWFAAYLDG